MRRCATNSPTACASKRSSENSAASRCNRATSIKSFNAPLNFARRGLEAPYAKVLEYLPAENRLEMRGGIGWGAGAIDNVTLGADLESPAGYAYHTGQSVISNHLHEEARFRTPQLLADHGIKRAINVLIERGNEISQPYGVLEVDSPNPGQFDRADADFLAVFAGLLGIAIERQQADAKLANALDYQALLTREMSHRVKNSLMSVVSLLRVQARSAQSEDIEHALDDASSRVETIAQVHDHLWRGEAIDFIELSDFVSELCKKMNETASGHTITCVADSLVLSADRLRHWPAGRVQHRSTAQEPGV